MSDTQVVFEYYPESGGYQELQNTRVMLGCMYRCFCNWGLASGALVTQPKVPSYLQAPCPITRWESNMTWEIDIDVVDDFHGVREPSSPLAPGEQPFVEIAGRYSPPYRPSIDLGLQSSLLFETMWL